MFTLKGLKRFLIYTRRQVPEEIINFYDIPEYNKITVEERVWLTNIKKAFSGEEIIEQFSIDRYCLDAYSPVHNIVIEIDENDHSGYNIAKEVAITNRVNLILKDPTWIRFNPYKADIFEVIGLIYTAIKK